MPETAGSSGGFEAALQQAAQEVSPASSTDTASSTSATPAAGAAAASATPETTDREPFIPRDRFDEVNRRMQAAEAFRSRFGFLEQIPPEQAQEVFRWAGRWGQDPIGFLTELLPELAQHQTHGQAVRSLAARLLAGSREASHADPEPAPDLQTAEGLQVYSADQLKKWHGWQRRQQAAELEQKLAPFEEDRRALQIERAQGQVRTWAEQQSKALTSRIEQLPYYDEWKADIIQVYESHPEMADPLDAYLLVKAQKQPGLERAIEHKVVSSLQQKAGAQTVNPAKPAPSPGFDPRKYKTSRAAFEAALETFAGK